MLKRYIPFFFARRNSKVKYMSIYKTYSIEKQKTVEEQKEDLDTYLAAQKKYNETGDKSILWNTMYPILIDMMSSAIKKKIKGRHINDLEDKVEEGAVAIIARYIKNPEKNYIYPKTAVYWMAVGLIYGDMSDRVNISLDDKLSNIDSELFVKVIN